MGYSSAMWYLVALTNGAAVAQDRATTVFDKAPQDSAPLQPPSHHHHKICLPEQHAIFCYPWGTLGCFALQAKLFLLIGNLGQDNPLRQGRKETNHLSLWIITWPF